MEPPSLPPGKLVVAHAERRAQRSLQQLAGATLCPVEVVADAAALSAAVDRDTIAIVDIELAHAAPGLRDRPARAWIAVPGEGVAPADPALVDALTAAGWRHVVAHPMPVLAEELLATIQKLRRREAFGLEKYVAWGAETRSYTLENARERDDAVGALARDVVGVGLPDRVGSLASVIADELIANALYLAPLDHHRQRHRAGEERARSRPLRGRDVVTVRWATDARYLAIEVRDRWGTLDPGGVTGRLGSGKATASAAAPGGEGGMGLALAYACCHQFVIDLEPDVMTEVIALLDVRHKPTELCRSASFHTFIVETAREP
ncbi:MAG TPA: hypothetical protein VK607_12045 [Kofleriaceae bacterium]|nr:hypothetical protein [Kofleriaceae bacterium]